MEDLLLHFNSLFVELVNLPPQRALSHQIWLLSDMASVAVWPYRYAHAQKVESEQQCSQMLQQGTIQPNSSTFSASVLLMKKSDNSWCLYIDYRTLKAKMIMDKFPIPVVEELLDDLRDGKYFTKLNLHSGYHQVHMHTVDIEMMAFQTQKGLIEFHVMPFGLTNIRRHSR
jgi:hypothetical protein